MLFLSGETEKGGDPMSKGFKGLVALTVFAVGTIVGSAAFADCATHKTTTASIDSSTLTASSSTTETKKPASGG